MSVPGEVTPRSGLALGTLSMWPGLTEARVKTRGEAPRKIDDERPGLRRRRGGTSRQLARTMSTPCPAVLPRFCRSLLPPPVLQGPGKPRSIPSRSKAMRPTWRRSLTPIGPTQACTACDPVRRSSGKEGTSRQGHSSRAVRAGRERRGHGVIYETSDDSLPGDPDSRARRPRWRSTTEAAGAACLRCSPNRTLRAEARGSARRRAARASGPGTDFTSRPDVCDRPE